MNKLTVFLIVGLMVILLAGLAQKAFWQPVKPIDFSSLGTNNGSELKLASATSTATTTSTGMLNKNNSTNTASSSPSQGLQIEILKPGAGAVAQKGSTVSVHYVGRLLNGQQFDSSIDRGEPFEFKVGVGAVIAGWDQGVLGMKVGEKRKLTVPSELAYGPKGTGPIPPNATLVFEVELLAVK